MTFFKMSIYARSGRGPATRILTVYFCTILVSTLNSILQLSKPLTDTMCAGIQGRLNSESFGRRECR